MAKRNLASMPVDALLKLRRDISELLSRRAEGLKRELRSLGQDYAEVGRIALYGKKKASKKRKKKVSKTSATERTTSRAAKNRRRQKVNAQVSGVVGRASKKRKAATAKKTSKRRAASRHK